MPVGRTKNKVAQLHEPNHTWLRQQDEQQGYKQRGDQRLGRKVLEYSNKRYVRIRHFLTVTIAHAERAFKMRSRYLVIVRRNMRRIVSVDAYAQTLREQQRQEQPGNQNAKGDFCEHVSSLTEISH